MGAIDGRTWLEVLSPRECRRLLHTTSLGRFAYIADDHPEVLPVNFALDEDDAIVFRTDPGTKLRAAITQPKVAFEVDGAPYGEELGWSVLIVGRARRVTDADELRRVRDLGVHPLAHGVKEEWVRIEPISMTGRRIVPTGS